VATTVNAEDTNLLAGDIAVFAPLATAESFEEYSPSGRYRELICWC